MSAIRNVLITAALGLAMIAFVPVTSFAQATSNPSSVGSPATTPPPLGTTSPTPGSPTAQAPASTATQPQNGPTGQPLSSGIGPASPSPRNSSVTPDQRAEGTAGPTTTTYVPIRRGHAGIIIALIVLATIIVLAIAMAGQNRRTNVPNHRIG